jgi:Zn-dependent protease
VFVGWMIGWASAPYDPAWRMRYPKRAAWMALAGPLANFALLVLAGLAIHIGIALEAFQPPQRVGFDHVVSPAAAGLPAVLATLVSIFFSMNLLLATFNLLPFPPLDGNTAIGLFLSDKTAQWFAEFSSNPMFAWIGLFAAWKIFGAVFSPAFLFAINLLYPTMSYR